MQCYHITSIRNFKLDPIVHWLIEVYRQDAYDRANVKYCIHELKVERIVHET
jgi:hypothetical protein